MEVAFPSISPDGKEVAFTPSGLGTYVVSMDGGEPQRIAEKSVTVTWSPDGNRLLFGATTDPHCSEKNKGCLLIFDVRTGNISVVPSSQGVVGPLWVPQDILFAFDCRSRLCQGRLAVPKFVTFDFKTQRWNDLVAGNFVDWGVSLDGKYLVFTTGGAEPKVQRLRFADRQIETITA